MQGLTGVVKFDEKGLRTEFELEIVGLGFTLLNLMPRFRCKELHGLKKVCIITEMTFNWNYKKRFISYFEEKTC